MRFGGLSLFSVFLLLSACGVVSGDSEQGAHPGDTDIAELLACNDRAEGGDALRRLQRVEYDLEIVEPGFVVQGHYAADRHGPLRVDIYTNGVRVFSEGWDGMTGWQLPQGATQREPATDAGADALRHSLEQPGHFWTLQDMAPNGHAVEIVADVEGAAPGIRIVQVTLRDGFQSWHEIDIATCRVTAKRDFRAFHPDLDPSERWIETRFEDFRSQDGITKAWTTINVDLMTGDTVGTTRLVTVHAEMGR